MEARSPLDAAVSCVGDRWSLLIVDALLDGPRRFGELEAEVAGVSPNILSQRLKALEQQAVVVSRPYSQRPLRSTYELTASGRELAGALRLLAQWGSSRPDASSGPNHDACGTPLEARWYCPTCARVVTGPTDSDLHHV